jgi:hypothetical protein
VAGAVAVEGAGAGEGAGKRNYLRSI